MPKNTITPDTDAVLGKFSESKASKAKSIRITSATVNSDFVKRVAELSGVDANECYQCGKCSAGCPAAEEMDIIPSELIRLIQLGQEQDVLESNTIWVCASCFQCFTRCPKGIDFSRLAEALRYLAMGTEAEYLCPECLPVDLVAELPQQALVSAFRKYGL